MSTCSRIVPVTRALVTPAIETKIKRDVLYLTGSYPAEERYGLNDGIKFLSSSHRLIHSENYNHKKILKFSLVHSSTKKGLTDLLID